jgi:hypothetical protein
MPNHLRPSTSYKALSSGRFETPKTFKDRIYLTDVADVLKQVILRSNEVSEIKLLWRKGYFPWRLRIKILGGSILLTGKLYGDSSWTSSVLMQFKNLEGAARPKIDRLLKEYVAELGRLPYDSPYWTDEVWKKFGRTQKLTRIKIEEAWAGYVL